MTDDDNPATSRPTKFCGPPPTTFCKWPPAGQIDLNKLARLELRARLRHEATQQIAAMAARAP